MDSRSGRFRIHWLSALIIFITLLPPALTASPTGDPALDESLSTLTAQVGDGVEPFMKVNLALRFNQPLEELMELHRSGLDVGEIFLVSWIAVERKESPAAVYRAFLAAGAAPGTTPASGSGLGPGSAPGPGSGPGWKAWLESLGIKKGNKAYKKLYQASVNIHPKPYFPGKH